MRKTTNLDAALHQLVSARRLGAAFPLGAPRGRFLERNFLSWPESNRFCIPLHPEKQA